MSATHTRTRQVLRKHIVTRVNIAQHKPNPPPRDACLGIWQPCVIGSYDMMFSHRNFSALYHVVSHNAASAVMFDYEQYVYNVYIHKMEQEFDLEKWP